MLRGTRQLESLNNDFVCPFTQERGGVLSFANPSGITFLEYAREPSGAIPLGIQYNDIEYMDLSRQFPTWHLKETDQPCGIVGAVTQGDLETDWLYIIGTLTTGDKAYVGPSGTITNYAALGGHHIGKFLSPLTIKPHQVVFSGLGFSSSYMQNQVVINDNATIVWVDSPGFARVRITQKDITTSQL
jgi:hypothetical protein